MLSEENPDVADLSWSKLNSEKLGSEFLPGLLPFSARTTAGTLIEEQSKDHQKQKERYSSDKYRDQKGQKLRV